MGKTWGKHLILDIHGVKKEKLQDIKGMNLLLNDLVKKFGMRILHKPVVVKVSSPKYPEWGVSGFVMIYESHISVHTWPEENYIAMDVYSCKDFDNKAIAAYLKKYWNCKTIKTRLVIRG